MVRRKKLNLYESVDVELHGMCRSGSCSGRIQVLLCLHINQVVDDLVEESELKLGSPGCEWFPLQRT